MHSCMHISRCVFIDLILKLKKLLTRYRHPTIDHRSLEPTKMNPRIKIEATHYATPQLQRVQRRRWSKLSWTQACPNASAGIVGCISEQMSSPGTCGGLGPFRRFSDSEDLGLKLSTLPVKVQLTLSHTFHSPLILCDFEHKTWGVLTL